MRLYEALIKDETYKAHYDRVAAEARRNPLFRKVISEGIREGIFSDEAHAIGQIHDAVIQAAYPAAIGRELIQVRTTTKTLERFIKEVRSSAYVSTEAGEIKVIPAKYNYVDVYCDIVIKAASEWTRELVEDATWNVMDRQLQAIGKEVAIKETQRIIDLYEGISTSDLAGGDELDGGGTGMDWAKLRRLWHALQKENITPTVVAMNPTHIAQLLGSTEFIHSAYAPSETTDIRKGVISEVLGMRVVTSTLIPEGKAYALDAELAAVLLVRRDLTTEPYEDPKKGIYGVVATERIGLGVIQPKAVARMVNIATTV